jgi:hypothetical protein
MSVSIDLLGGAAALGGGFIELIRCCGADEMDRVGSWRGAPS